jgi:glycine/D-amino acid oxidase-like deaminating enzyme
VTISHWLQTADDDPTPREPLDGSRDVDVVIVGAGFTGLWTAREVLRRDPSRSVLICEANTAGFGASGRNGAWLSAGIAVSPAELARRTSPTIARDTILAMRDTVQAVIDACDADGIDAQIRRGGILRLARGPQELPALRAGFEQLAAVDVADDIRLLSAEETADRVRVKDALGALYDPHAAAFHPGRLVRGLARAVEAAGATIVEHTPVTRIRPAGDGQRAGVLTPGGRVTADAVIVACEAWVSQLPDRRRDVLPLYSLIVLTEPIEDEVWHQIGWEGHELLSSHRYTVDYLSRTVDGRVLFGGRGAPYHFGSRIDPSYDQHPVTHDLLRDQLRTWFPALTGVGFASAWGGPLAMPRDWMPTFHLDPGTGIGGAYGYTGQGVGTSNLAGRVLADLIVDGSTPFQDLPMVGHHARRWEPEPLRWLGARYLQRSLARLDARTARTGVPATGRSLAERLLRH